MALGSKGCIFLGLVVFLLCAAFIIIKTWCLFLNGASLLFWRQPSEAPSEGTDPRVPAVPSGCVVSCRGMQLASIRSLPAFHYGEPTTDVSGSEVSKCSICFTTFHPGDWLRSLPNCTHVFHLPCVDRWLRDNSTCPLCRRNVLHDFGVIQMETMEREGVGHGTPLNYRLLDLGYMIQHSGEEEQLPF